MTFTVLNPDRPQLLRWNNGSGSRPTMGVVRHHHSARTHDDVAHHHDFYEVFWVEEGVVHHWLNGTIEQLVPGDCVFIRAKDAHAFGNPGNSRVTWTNVTVSSATVQALEERYAEELGWWPWRASGPATHVHLSLGRIERLQAYAGRLPARIRAIDADWFLCQLLRLAERTGPGDIGDQQPTWLQEAIMQLRDDPGLLPGGVVAFVSSCGRCPEHVNRLVRQHYGMTTSELVRQVRLEHAARQLRVSDKDILNIALDCGFSNLSYFYRSFKACYDITPRRFRRERRYER